MLTALMAATEPRLTPSELQKNCEKLAAEKFNRETANDEDRFDYGGHYNARLKKRFYMGRLTHLIRLWVLISKIVEFTAGITGPPILAFLLCGQFQVLRRFWSLHHSRERRCQTM